MSYVLQVGKNLNFRTNQFFFRKTQFFRSVKKNSLFQLNVRQVWYYSVTETFQSDSTGQSVFLDGKLTSKSKHFEWMVFFPLSNIWAAFNILCKNFSTDGKDTIENWVLVKNLGAKKDLYLLSWSQKANKKKKALSMKRIVKKFIINIIKDDLTTQ